MTDRPTRIPGRLLLVGRRAGWTEKRTEVQHL